MLSDESLMLQEVVKVVVTVVQFSFPLQIFYPYFESLSEETKRYLGFDSRHYFIPHLGLLLYGYILVH